MQLCENNNMHTLRGTEDTPEKMPAVCQKTLKRQRSGHALTQASEQPHGWLSCF